MFLPRDKLGKVQSGTGARAWKELKVSDLGNLAFPIKGSRVISPRDAVCLDCDALVYLVLLLCSTAWLLPADFVPLDDGFLLSHFPYKWHTRWCTS